MTDKETWEERRTKIKAQFPSTDLISWGKALQNDNEVFALVLGDLIKAEGKRSRPGKRPSLSRPLAEAELLRLAGEDYSSAPFLRTFRALTFGRSVRGIANKTGLGQTTVQRLLHGAEPSFSHMEKIAAAYKKHPSYFLEYRIAYVGMVIDGYLREHPETATVWYLKMRGKNARNS